MIDSSLSFRFSDWILLDLPVLIVEILVLIMVNLGMIIRIMHKNYLTYKTGSCTFSWGHPIFSRNSFAISGWGETEVKVNSRIGERGARIRLLLSCIA